MKFPSVIILLAFSVPPAVDAASFVKGHTGGTGSELLDDNGGGGADLFVDASATGGDDIRADNGQINRAFLVENVWNVGAAVELSGMAIPIWANSDSTDNTNNTQNGTLTVDFYDLGADGAFSGIGAETLINSVPVSFTLANSGVDSFHVNFDTPIAFTSSGTGVAMVLTHSAAVRLKEGPAGSGVTQVNRDSGAPLGSGNLFSMTLAGSAVGGSPPPTSNTATQSGDWDEVVWDVSSGGTTQGGLAGSDTALVGQYRTIRYRGIPADQTIATLQLGESSSAPGQGVFELDSGMFTVSGDLVVGRNSSPNDSFVHVNGGTLSVGGDAIFGRSVEACDGSLVIAGGEVDIDGDLALGGFEEGGAMLRFHNPGSSPAIDVGGSLILGRCSLDLTFDSNYAHVPGTIIPLVSFVDRDGQFLNFRHNQDFNCGPNRFRIEYLTDSIQLVALENWAPSSARPNIILLFTAAQGYADLRLHGDARYPMPTLETLASTGARFTDAYVSAGVCHPSRCGLLTGVHQQRLGSDNNLGGPSYNGMATAQRTVPRRLQGLGYKTYGIGKWHLGDTVEFHPNLRGFDNWYGMWAGSRSYWSSTSEGNVFQDQMMPDFASEDDTYLTDRIGDKTVDFIDQHLSSSTDPFFMYVSFTAVHGPVDIDSPPAPKPADPRYARLASEFGLDASDYENSPRTFGQSQAVADKNRYDLAAMTLALDENIGKIVDRLSETPGLLENTLIVYLNDNGGAEWAQGFGGNYSYNNPLKGKKGGSMQDGSIRVPCVASWPGGFAGNQVINEPVTSLDFVATFVNAAGDAPVAARNGLDGLDLMPLIRDGSALPEDRVITWRAGGVTGGGTAIRQGDWKLWINDPGGAPQLYNLRSDIDENNNRSAEQPALADELLERYLAWEAGTLPPAYGTADTLLDSGRERHPFTGGLRLKTPSVTPLWQSASRRNPLSLNSGFSLGFLLRASEVGPFGPSSGLWHALADSTNRSEFIRFGIDYQNSSLVIHEGKTGASSSAAITLSPRAFVGLVVSYEAASHTISLKSGDVSTSLVLGGSYGALGVTAMGASAMEGEITTLRPVMAGSGEGTSRLQLDVGDETMVLSARLGSSPPFAPRLERSLGLVEFNPDANALTESLGGGLFRVSSSASGEAAEFYRLNLSQP